MTQYPWQMLLNADLNQLKNSLPEYKEKGGSLIYWMLKKNHIEFDQYLSWAQSHYGMAFLQSAFFEKVKSGKIWHKYIHTYKWTKECIPVGEWEDTLLVACIEPPQDIPHFPKIIPVIAHPSDIESMWNSYNNDNIFSFENFEETSDSADSQSEPQAEEVSGDNELPAGWGNDDPATRIIPSFKNGSVIPEAPTMIRPKPTLAEIENTPEGFKPTPALSLKISQLASTEDNEATIIRPTMRPATDVETPPIATQQMNQENEPTMIRPASKSAEDNEATMIRPTLKASTEDNEATIIRPTLKSSTEDNEVTMIKPTMNQREVKAPNLVIEEIETSTDQVVNHDEIHTFFSQLENHYEKSVLFLLKDNLFAVYSWSRLIKPHKTKLKDSIPVDSPSIFKIIYTTQKSYHGHIALNDVNEEFFENWNQGQIPDLVTATPLADNDKVFGFLVSFADNNVNKKASISHHEKITEKIKNYLFQANSQKIAS